MAADAAAAVRDCCQDDWNKQRWKRRRVHEEGIFEFDDTEKESMVLDEGQKAVCRSMLQEAESASASAPEVKEEKARKRKAPEVKPRVIVKDSAEAASAPATCPASPIRADRQWVGCRKGYIRILSEPENSAEVTSWGADVAAVVTNFPESMWKAESSAIIAQSVSDGELSDYRCFEHVLAAADMALRDKFLAPDCWRIAAFLRFILEQLGSGRRVALIRPLVTLPPDRRAFFFILYLLMRYKRGYPRKIKYSTKTCKQLMGKIKPSMLESFTAGLGEFSNAAAALSAQEDFDVE